MNDSNYFELAQLAEAAYADLWDDATGRVITSNSRVIEALQSVGFSPSQATELTSNWQIVSGSHQANTESGYSSTLFKNTDGSYVLAFRGTESNTAEDLDADIRGIVGNGLALKQIVDLYNEWQHITAAQGASYNAAHLSYLATESTAYTEAMLKLADPDPDIRAFAQEAIDALKARTDVVFDGTAAYTIEYVDSATLFTDERATGLGLAGDIAAHGLTVTGHSLGGHLATAFTRLFPETGASALTVNGAGCHTTTSMLSGRASNNFSNRFPTLGGSSNFGADHARSPKHFYQYGLMAPFSPTRSAY
jgi:hypothetical protein